MKSQYIFFTPWLLQSPGTDAAKLDQWASCDASHVISADFPGKLSDPAISGSGP